MRDRDNRRKLDILTILLLLGTGCSQVMDLSNDFINVHSPKQGITDPRIFNSSNVSFDHYLKKFEDTFSVTVSDIPVNFSLSLYTENAVGVCVIYSTGDREILIRLSTWSFMNDYEREILIFHELGHCVLDRKHRDNMVSYSCPSSIMRSWMFSWWEIFNCYIPMYNYYIDELGG